MATHRAPKQWTLSKHESITSFESWHQNLQYILSLDSNFAPFLVDGFTWLKKSGNPLRGLTDDGEGVPEAKRRTAEQKVTHLDLMLGQIANYCPVISRNTIVKNSTSLANIWQAIRLHYGFQRSGSNFLNFNDIKLEPDERPEDLYQRLMSFAEDNLLKADGNIKHHGDVPTDDEDLTPSMENFIILTWLRLIHASLPALVKQRYGTDLRSKTLASIKPEISQALDSLLDEIHSFNESKILRTAFKSKLPSSSKRTPICPLCKQAGRPRFQHYLSKCNFLPDSDKQFLNSRVRQTTEDNDYVENHYQTNDQDDQYEPANDTPQTHYTAFPSSSRRVSTTKSPTMKVFHKHYALLVTLDTGAEISMIKSSVAKHIGATIQSTSQKALQADGSTPLNITGETHITLTRGKHHFKLDALVVDNLDVDVLAGVTFMAYNDISVRPSKHEINIGDNDKIVYSAFKSESENTNIRHVPPFVLRITSSAVVWPGEYLEVDILSDVHADATLAIEKRYDCGKTVADWPSPQLIEAVDGKIRIFNDSPEPQKLHKHDHFCQVRLTSPVTTVPLTLDVPTSSPSSPQMKNSHDKPTAYSESVNLDPDNILPPRSHSEFQSLHDQFDDVFSSDIKRGYNGAVGPFQAKVNMGPVQPPQRKGRVPQYNRDKLIQLQQKFDELECQGVFCRPEDLNISVEYLNPSFLVTKPQGGYRLVTDFADVGRYSKPQPSLMPDVDSILRLIAPWKYIIKTDLTSAFYQIPLSKDSLKYCGVATPFKGIRVYTRTAMGMPGSETALEELMCRVLGDCIQDGIVAKLADDLYCGGNTPDELYTNWKRVLTALHKSNLKLSPSKTVVAPASTTILGWTWSNGIITANAHRISVLSTCPPPTTVRSLRSFIGAYKVLARVIPNCSSILAPLDEKIAGRPSQEKLEWTDDLHVHFANAQNLLKTHKAIILPRASDQLWIVTDGSVVRHGIGATLYVTRNNKLSLAGFFSAKLRKHQVTWLPCEIEALAIAAAIKHFSPFIVQSKHRSCILTDSKPCVQAIEKLYRGEFSASPRLTSFLSLVSRYNLNIRHLAGSANIPSDFASRNAPDCTEPHCQICSFIIETEDSVVRSVQVNDILNNLSNLPFTTRSAWLDIQSECPDLRRTHAHLKQGTRPSKKITNIKDVKRYLNVVSIAKDNLLVVPKNDPLTPYNELIVVPRSVIDGLVTALHLKLNHPTKHQMQLVMKRHFYALDLNKAIDCACESCHTCTSLQKYPKALNEQSTTPPPEVVGIYFAADVLKRNKQLILVLRETVSSYTTACMIENEKQDTLRVALLKLVLGLHPLEGPSAIIRCDAAPGFVALRDDETLKSFKIVLEIGRVKNVNKNPVAERAILEFENELLRHDPSGGPVSELGLSIVIARLNSRIRNCGLSSRELWTQRNQFTNEQLPLSDRALILSQHENRIRNHPYSEKSKLKGQKPLSCQELSVGDIVYLVSEKSKLKARDRYLITSIENPWCYIKKFSGSQLRAASYKVKLSECYRVQSQFSDCTPNQVKHESNDDLSTDVEDDDKVPQFINIPDTLSRPAYEPLNPIPNENNLLSMDVSSEVADECDLNSSHSNVELNTTNTYERPQRARKPPSYLSDYELS